MRFGTTLWSIVECAQAGDRTAMDRIMRHYRPALLNFANRQGLSESESEDAAQEALLRLMDAIKKVIGKRQCHDDPHRGVGRRQHDDQRRRRYNR